MKWSLLELSKYQSVPLTFDTTLELTDVLQQKESMIFAATPIHVAGFISVDATSYVLHYEVSTTLTLPSTRSLEPVLFPMNFSVDELFMTPEQFQANKEEVEEHEVLMLDTQTLDLDESVADNIVLAIPLQVLTEEEKQGKTLPSGSGWTVFSEEDYTSAIEEEQQSTIDPRLAKLSEFLSENDDE